MESGETRVGKRRRDRRGMKIKKKGEQADQKKDGGRKGEEEGRRKRGRIIHGLRDEGSAGDRSMSEGLLAEIEQLPNQLCTSGPAVRLQGIPRQEHIKERS